MRYACEADLPLLIELARREHAASPWADVPFDSAATEGTMRSFMLLCGRTLLMSERGYLAGMVQAMGFTERRIALEYAWYSEDGHGLELLAAFEGWAHRMGAVAVVAHNYTGRPKLVDVLRRRRGYTMVGEAISKRLEH